MYIRNKPYCMKKRGNQYRFYPLKFIYCELDIPKNAHSGPNFFPHLTYCTVRLTIRC